MKYFEKIAIKLTSELAEKLMANRAIRTLTSDSMRPRGGNDWYDVGLRTSKQLRSLASKLKDSAPEPLKDFVRRDYYVPDRGLESSVNQTLQNAFWNKIKGPHTGQQVDAIQMLYKKYNPKVGTKAHTAYKAFIADLSKRHPHLVLEKNPDRVKRIFDGEIPDYFK